MCLALYKPAKATLDRDEMKVAFENNADGAGFAYYDQQTRRVEIMRGYFDFDSFWAALNGIVLRNHLGAIVHFRMATHGTIDTDNCHPFPLTDGALIHNGVINGMAERKYNFGGKDAGLAIADRSDTRVFVEDYLRGMEWRDLEKARHLIEERIGWSKLVTIHNDGTVLIFNEKQGHWRNGVWYSNDSYLEDNSYYNMKGWSYSDRHSTPKDTKESKKARKARRKAAREAFEAANDGVPGESEVTGPDAALEAALAERHGWADAGDHVFEYECPNCCLELRDCDFVGDHFQCPDCGYIGSESEAMGLV